VLSRKLEEYGPRVVAFNGKLTYEQFSQRKCKFGLQKERLYGAQVYVLPAVTAQHGPAKADRMKHFRGLARLVESATKSSDAQRV